MNITRGPWRNCTMGDATKDCGLQIIGKGGIHIATCHYGGSKTADLDEARSNSRLIALSPAGFKITEAILTHWDNPEFLQRVAKKFLKAADPIYPLEDW